MSSACAVRRKITSMARRILIFVLAFAASVAAQPAGRRATNLAALIGHPAFYHSRQVVVIGNVKLENNGELRVTTDGASMPIVFKGSAPDGIDEVRGEFWDLGRMGADNPRL